MPEGKTDNMKAYLHVDGIVREFFLRHFFNEKINTIFSCFLSAYIPLLVKFLESKGLKANEEMFSGVSTREAITHRALAENKDCLMQVVPITDAERIALLEAKLSACERVLDSVGALGRAIATLHGNPDVAEGLQKANAFREAIHTAETAENVVKALQAFFG